jgi:hypothetical protein
LADQSSAEQSSADQTVMPTPLRLKPKSFQISTLVLSFSTIACLEFQSENPSP